MFQRLVGTEGPVTLAHRDGDTGPVPPEELSGLKRPTAQSCCWSRKAGPTEVPEETGSWTSPVLGGHFL